MKTIVVPIDFSPTTAKVCAAASALARPLGARLTFIHVVPSLPLYPQDFYATERRFLADITRRSRESAERKLGKSVKRWSTSGRRAKACLKDGETVPEILACAKRTKAIYLVIGSHGRGAMYDLLVGSTTHCVLRRARCPV